MTPAFAKLLEISSEGISPNGLSGDDQDAINSCVPELGDLLGYRNGFMAFEGALRIFPFRTVEKSHGLAEWNSPELWRAEYPWLSNEVTFFGEDVFGHQFGWRRGEVCTFDPETGELEVLNSSLRAFIASLLLDYRVLTGFDLAHEWQKKNGALRPRWRLFPRLPFTVGGAYEVLNLYDDDSITGIRRLASFARQIRSLPDGTSINFVEEGR